MSRITRAFAGGKAFIPFITGGDPDLETTVRLVPAMAEAGANLIEIGIPFSDPVAEGVVIQEASKRALSGGCTTDKLLAAVIKIRQKTDVPLLFMTYFNPIFTYGKESFLSRCAGCGIDGVIVPDLPLEEKDELDGVCGLHGIDLISMIAPTSEDRIAMIAREARGFIYCVSSLGVTGVRSGITTDIGKMVQRVRGVTSVPCAVGFGISTPEQAGSMARLADGVIAGSAIVELVAKYGRDSVEPVMGYVRGMKRGMKDALKWNQGQEKNPGGGHNHVQKYFA
ncbi:MAG: Tryptophan synthase alpha chain [Firmicutes bacterium ADurb.Bin456]|nr:MAG: Tryptophan synthase alpha chain [Firmicutes bacterium ADurb.Bin456]